MAGFVLAHKKADFIGDAVGIGLGDLFPGLFGQRHLFLDQRRGDFLDGFLANTLACRAGISQRLGANVFTPRTLAFIRSPHTPATRLKTSFRGLRPFVRFFLVWFFCPKHGAIMAAKD